MRTFALNPLLKYKQFWTRPTHITTTASDPHIVAIVFIIAGFRSDLLTLIMPRAERSTNFRAT